MYIFKLWQIQITIYLHLKFLKFHFTVNNKTFYKLKKTLLFTFVHLSQLFLTIGNVAITTNVTVSHQSQFTEYYINICAWPTYDLRFVMGLKEQVGRHIYILWTKTASKLLCNFCAFQLSLAWLNSYACCIPKHPFTSPHPLKDEIRNESVAAWESGQMQILSPWQFPLAVCNQFANIASPHLHLLWECVRVCVKPLLPFFSPHSILFGCPTCSIFHSNLFSCAYIFSLRVASAHPCISFWLGRFVWFKLSLDCSSQHCQATVAGATPPTPTSNTLPFPTCLLYSFWLHHFAQWLAYDLLFKVYHPLPISQLPQVAP